MGLGRTPFRDVEEGRDATPELALVVEHRRRRHHDVDTAAVGTLDLALEGRHGLAGMRRAVQRLFVRRRPTMGIVGSLRGGPDSCGLFVSGFMLAGLERDGGSILHLWRSLIALRKQEAALMQGDYEPIRARTTLSPSAAGWMAIASSCCSICRVIRGAGFRRRPASSCCPAISIAGRASRLTVRCCCAAKKG